jgi:hypothetical protein
VDPQIVAAMVSSIATLGTSVFEKWGRRPRAQIDTRVEERVDEHYDTLRALLTDHCVRVLKRMEDGQNHAPIELLRTIYLEVKEMGYEDVRRLEHEFEYRLRFLEVLGVVTRPTSEYFITTLGMTFLQKARDRRDYFEVLFR